MEYISQYKSECGIINLSSDGKYLTGLWFAGSKDETKHNHGITNDQLEIFIKTKQWLDIYFSGKQPDFLPPYKFVGLTPFQREVISYIENIPYGTTITYDDIARQIALKHNIAKMSAQAVGQAVASNPICIIIPCHRVMGKDNKVTGFGGGIANKVKLLQLEGIDTTNFKYPKNYLLSLPRCSWCNMDNPLYINYHDNYWGKLNTDNQYLFKMFCLESFQAGLSWECILGKQKAMEKAFDNFDYNKIAKYNEHKVQQLINNKDIIRNQLKIKAMINNAKIYLAILDKYNDFYEYLKLFTKGNIYYSKNEQTENIIYSLIKDLKDKGMKFIGYEIISSFLQATGIYNFHEKQCYLHKVNN